MMDGYQYSLNVTSAFAANTNVLPSLRTEIVTAFSDFLWDGKEASILSFEMRSASTFTVQVNDGTFLTAREVNSEYVASFSGSIAYIIFSSNTTLTSFSVEWAQDRKNHNVATLSVLAGSTLSLANDYGVNVPVAGTNQYELQMGTYVATATLTGYSTTSMQFYYNMEATVLVPQEKLKFSVNPTLSHVNSSPGNPTIVEYGESYDLSYYTDFGYALPTSVTVTGATGTWDQATGTVSLANVTGDVSFAIAGVPIEYNIVPALTNVTANGGNANAMTVEAPVTLLYTANAGYTLPDSVTVAHATSTWSTSADGGSLELSAPNGTVEFAISGEAIEYTITPTLSNVVAASTNPLIMTVAESVDLTYTAADGYTLPMTVDVTGASSIWVSETGILHLSNVTSNVTFSITAVPAAYSITPTLQNVTADVGNATTITVASPIELTYAAETGYTLPDAVTVVGATGVWDAATGKLTLSAPTENVTFSIVGTVQ